MRVYLYGYTKFFLEIKKEVFLELKIFFMLKSHTCNFFLNEKFASRMENISSEFRLNLLHKRPKNDKKNMREVQFVYLFGFRIEQIDSICQKTGNSFN